MIYDQLQSTPLGKWTEKGHQRFTYYCDQDDKITAIMTNDDDMRALVPVDIVDKRGIKIIGRQIVHPKHVQEIRYTSIDDALFNAPEWIKKLWNKQKWNNNMVQKNHRIIKYGLIEGIHEWSDSRPVGSILYVILSQRWKRPCRKKGRTSTWSKQYDERDKG